MLPRSFVVMMMSFALLAGLCATGNAASITVTGDCTLSDAILAANTDAPVGACPAGSGADTIVLTGNVTLSTVAFSDPFFGDSGLPLIASEISIEGNGHTISRSGADRFRLFQIKGYFQAPVGSTGSLALNNVVLSGGNVAAPTLVNMAVNGGGAVLNAGGSLIITNSLVRSNFAWYGGAVANLGGGAANIANSTFGGESANVAVRGGAIYNDGFSSISGVFTASKLSTRRTLFLGNEARFDFSNPLAFTGFARGGAVSNEAIYEDAESTFQQNHAACGGAISNMSFGATTSLTSSVFQQNVAGAAGAVANYNASDVTARNSRFVGNAIGPVFVNPAGSGPVYSCTIGGLSGGAAINNSNNGDLVVTDSSFEGNTAFGGNGGAIYAGTNGRTDLLNSVVTGNSAESGGGLSLRTFNANIPVNIVNTTIDNNSANGSGGVGVDIQNAPVTIRGSRIRNNTGAGNSDGGGVGIQSSTSTSMPVSIADTVISGNKAGEGGGIYAEDTEVTIERSTISGNEIPGAFKFGAGIHQGQASAGVSAMMRILNSTVSGNLGGTAGGGLRAQGPVEITNSTIAGNSSLRHGGISSLAGGTLVRNSIVANNIATSADGTGDCFAGSLTNGGNNLNTDGTCTGFTTVAPAAIALGALAENGGATPTHALGVGSVAIDAIAGGCAEVGNVDQRTAGRDTQCDIGAFEAGRILPLVSFVQAASEAFEGSGLHKVQVQIDNRLGDLSAGELTLYLRVMGSASPDSDYTLLSARPFAVNVPPAGVLSFVDIDFDILDDSDFEGDETIALTLTLVGPGTLGASEHVVTIRDSEGLNECVVAQKEVQEIVGDYSKVHYRNKGMQMKLINETLKAIEKRDGKLLEGCRGCIVSQFARGILVADQTDCTCGIAEP